MNMKIRNRFVMFLLIGYLRTIYILYWQHSVQKSIKKADPSQLSAGLTVLLTVCSCGIYYLIWQWKICTFLKENGEKNSRALCLVLSLLIIGIPFNPLIIQGHINRFLRRDTPASA